MSKRKYKLYSFNRNKSCFYCGKKSPSKKAHVLPRIFFKHRINPSFTVPGCDDHNQMKSNEDRAMLYLFLRMFEYLFKSGSTKFEPAILEIYQREEKFLKQANKEIEFSEYLVDPIPLVDSVIPRLNFEPHEWILLLSAGMIWEILGTYDENIIWEKKNIYFPNHIGHQESLEESLTRYDKDIKMLESLGKLNWVEGWAQNYPKDIYKLSFIHVEDREYRLLHHFFKTYSIFVNFTASKSLQKKLNQIETERELIEFVL